MTSGQPTAEPSADLHVQHLTQGKITRASALLLHIVETHPHQLNTEGKNDDSCRRLSALDQMNLQQEMVRLAEVFPVILHLPLAPDYLTMSPVADELTL